MGSSVKGTISAVYKKRAIIQLTDDVHGVIIKSELNKKIKNAYNIFQKFEIADEIEVEIRRIGMEENIKNISLSISPKEIGVVLRERCDTIRLVHHPLSLNNKKYT